MGLLLELLSSSDEEVRARFVPASRDARISLCKKLVKDVAGDGAGDIFGGILAAEQTFNLRGRDGLLLVGLCGLCGLWLLWDLMWDLLWLHGVTVGIPSGSIQSISEPEPSGGVCGGVSLPTG